MPSPFRAGSRYTRRLQDPRYGGSPRKAVADRRLQYAWRREHENALVWDVQAAVVPPPSGLLNDSQYDAGDDTTGGTCPAVLGQAGTGVLNADLHSHA